MPTFIDKVSELRFLKIKDRQINKFNRLLLRKEGNITWLTNRANPQACSTSAAPLRQVVPRQVAPRQRALTARQSEPLPKPSELTPREIVCPPSRGH